MTLIKLASGCSVVAAWRLSQATLAAWCAAAAILLALMALCTVVWPFVVAWGFLRGDEELKQAAAVNFPAWIFCAVFMVGVVIATWSGRREKVI